MALAAARIAESLNVRRVRGLASCALVLLAVCAYLYRPGAAPAEVGLAGVFLFAGGVALGAAWWFTGPAAGSAVPPATTITLLPQLPGRIATLVGLGCLLLMAEGNSPHGEMGFHMQFALWLSGVLLVAWGMSAWRPRRLAVDRDLLPLLAIMLLGLLLRLVDLEGALHIFVDEMNFTEGVIKLWNPANDLNLLTPFGPITSFPWIFPYLQGLSVSLFGPTLAAMRLVSVIFGTLTIPALYLLAKALCNRPVALLAALLLATFPPHMHFSRLGMNNIADPLFGTLALALLARGMQSAARRDYALGGAALGMTQYFYEGGKLIFPPLAGVWLLVIYWRRAWFNPRGVILFFLTALLVALPLYYTLFAWRANFTPRIESQQVEGDYWTLLLFSGDGAQQIGRYFQERLGPALLHLVHLSDGSQAFYGGETALILPYLVPFFLLGVFHVLWRRRRAGVLLLTWIAFTVLGNSIIQGNTWSARFVVLLPALALLIAIGLHDTWRLIVPQRKFSAPLRLGVAVLLVIALAAQVVYYFGPHLAVFNRQIRPFKDGQDVAYRLAVLPQNTYVFVLGDELTYPPHVEILQAFWDLHYDVRFLHPLELKLLDIHRLPRDRNFAFFIEGDDTDTLQFLARYFDLDGPQYSPYNLPLDKQYVLYFVWRDGKPAG